MSETPTPETEALAETPEEEVTEPVSDEPEPPAEDAVEPVSAHDQLIAEQGSPV